MVKTENCLYIYIYGTCVFRICILPYLCAIQYFRIAYWVHVFTACSIDKTRKAEQWESTQQGFENGEEREALLARPRLIIDGVLRDCHQRGVLSVQSDQLVRI